MLLSLLLENLRFIRSFPFAAAAVMLLIGAALLFFGWTIYRVALVVFAMLVGAAIGAEIAKTFDLARLLLALPLGLLMGIGSIAFEKIGVFILGGAWVSLLVASSSRLQSGDAKTFFVSALVFILAGILSVLVWKLVVLIGLALSGATAIVDAMILFLMVMISTFKPGAPQRPPAVHPLLIGLAVGILTVFGVLFQTRKKKKPSTREAKGK